MTTEGTDRSADHTGESMLALVCSTAEEGAVYGAEYDPATGELTPVASTPFERPMFVAVGPAGEYAYVANRAGDGRVDAVSIDAESGALSVVDERSSGGVGPCHVSVDGAGRFAFTANYDGGQVGMLPLGEDGELGPPSDVAVHEGSGPVADRQEAAHPHAVVPGPDDRFVYVPDLGTDRIAVYRIDADERRLAPADQSMVDLPPGTGPRHLAFGPDGEYCYLVGELDSTVTALERDSATGALTPVERASTLTDDDGDSENYPADVHVHPSGEWLYVSNRGRDTIVTYRVGDGRLDRVGETPTGGAWPRDFAVDPAGNYLLVENRNSHDVTSLAVDADGGLSQTSTTEIQKPTCLAFVERS